MRHSFDIRMLHFEINYIVHCIFVSKNPLDALEIYTLKYAQKKIDQIFPSKIND